MLNITFDENGHGTYDYDGGVNYSLSWGIDTPPIGHTTLYYVLPFYPVNAGDLAVLEPVGTNEEISDLVRFVNVGEGEQAQARIYVYSDLPEYGELPPYDLADTGIPQTNPSAYVNEVGGEGYNYAVYEVPGFATYKLISDVPEPATLCLLGLGALSLIRRKRSV
jgi:hypothetical protein